MIVNYITDTDIVAYAPNIKLQTYPGQSTYENQINKAFDLVLNDFQKAGYDTRLCMQQLDLNNYDYTDNDVLVSISKTANYTGDVFSMKDRRRLVVDVSAISIGSSSWTVSLQGNNNVDEPESDDANWVDIDGSDITLNATEVYTVIVTSKYEWVRLKLLKNSAVSITLKAFLVETVYDDLICLRTLMLLYGDFRKAENDEWDFKYRQILEQYNVEMSKAQFYYDSNKSGSIDETEITRQEIRFIR
jgi:hypothetical protein